MKGERLNWMKGRRSQDKEGRKYMGSAIKKCSTCKMLIVMQRLTSHTIKKNAFVMLSVRSLRNFTFGTRDAKERLPFDAAIGNDLDLHGMLRAS